MTRSALQLDIRSTVHPKTRPRLHPRMHPYQGGHSGRPRVIARMNSQRFPFPSAPLPPPPPHLVHASENEYKNALFSCHSERVRMWCFTENDAVLPPSVLLLSEIALPLTESCSSDSDGEGSDANANDDVSDGAEYSHTGCLRRCVRSGSREVTSVERTLGLMEGHLIQLTDAQSDDDSGDSTELTWCLTEGHLLHLTGAGPPDDDSDDDSYDEERPEEQEGKGGMGCDTDTSDCDMVVTPPPSPGTEPTFCDTDFSNETTVSSDVYGLLSSMSSDTIEPLTNEQRDAEMLQRGAPPDAGSQRRFGRAMSCDCRGLGLTTRRPSLLVLQDVDQTLFERLGSLAGTTDDSTLHSESQCETKHDGNASERRGLLLVRSFSEQEGPNKLLRPCSKERSCSERDLSCFGLGDKQHCDEQATEVSDEVQQTLTPSYDGTLVSGVHNSEGGLNKLSALSTNNDIDPDTQPEDKGAERSGSMRGPQGPLFTEVRVVTRKMELCGL